MGNHVKIAIYGQKGETSIDWNCFIPSVEWTTPWDSFRLFPDIFAAEQKMKETCFAI